MFSWLIVAGLVMVGASLRWAGRLESGEDPARVGEGLRAGVSCWIIMSIAVVVVLGVEDGPDGTGSAAMAEVYDF